MITAVVWFVIIIGGIVWFTYDERKFNDREARHDYDKLIALGYPPEEAAWQINNAVEE
ncbi:hypothetical protein KII92_03110 [Leuconostoc gelidum subsp. gasicomitatum]|uniref:hypothetical protein n=1 Tax=Leuconostoc TaxID=1243 RepID=UPI001680EB97|nr:MULTISPECIES: hypothetical protein [Leuconostoc]MBZ5943943.1 hypothetical protein [Leuconostoc gasicomitatum]MBZ5973053.1 hypothetical protein [Leuconostoc gasicomitatum]